MSIVPVWDRRSSLTKVAPHTNFISSGKLLGFWVLVTLSFEGWKIKVTWSKGQ